MAQFFVKDENDIRRCRESLASRMPITITVTIDDKIKAFRGVVQSVEEDRNRTPWRYRVTMKEAIK